MSVATDSEMPVWDGFLVHVLAVLEDGQTLTARELYEAVADHADVSAIQRLETIASGDARYKNRIGWAVSSLARAGAVERPRRGHYRTTARGRTLLAQHPQGFGEPVLKAFQATDEPSAEPQGASETLVAKLSGSSPAEQISDGIERIHRAVGASLMDQLRRADPAFLESVVVDVLVAMGYGGAGEQRARHIGGSGDGGVDGVIDQDPLGLGRIYVQAKRYAADNVVGRPAIQGFVGALHGQQANQGVFITTSSFSREARDYAKHVNAAVVLIDGTRLTDLMIQYRVGVQVEQTYTVVKVDEDYFEL